MKSNPSGRLKEQFVWLTHRFGLSPLIRSLRKEARATGGVIRFNANTIELDTGDLLVRFRKKSIYTVASYIRRYGLMWDRLIPQNIEGRKVIRVEEGVFFKLRSGDVIELLDMPELTDPFAGYIEKGAPGKGDVVLDAGAFCGECTIEFARMVGESGHVYALEPDPINRKVMLRNLQKNGISNVTIFPYALWNANEALSFAVRGDSASAVTAVSMFETERFEKLEVEGKTAGVIFEQMGRLPDFIKMDIEGAEVEAVESMIPHFKTSGPRCRMAIASYHSRAGRRTHEIITPALSAAGFHVETGYPQHPTTWATWEGRNR